MSKQNLNNKSVDELREMKAKSEEKIRRLENKNKYLDSQAKQLTRKERTHRLCTRAPKTPFCKSAQLYTMSEQAAYLSFPCSKLCLHENSITPLFFLFPKKIIIFSGIPFMWCHCDFLQKYSEHSSADFI